MGTSAITRRQAVRGAVGIGTGALVASSATARAASTPTVLGAGSRGSAVATLQNRLGALGYWCGAADGAFGAQTTQAVLAVQKVAGLTRDGVAGAATQGALARGVRPGSRRGGDRLEVDKTRQVVLVVRGGAVKYVLNTSTGNGEAFVYEGRQIRAVTPSGEFTIDRHGTNGWDYGALGGLWRPYYFNGGIAFHGADQVPAYPASHGCCRLSIPAQSFLIASGILHLGEPVSVY